MAIDGSFHLYHVHAGLEQYIWPGVICFGANWLVILRV
jgi:hypothetical protein